MTIRLTTDPPEERRELSDRTRGLDEHHAALAPGAWSRVADLGAELPEIDSPGWAALAAFDRDLIGALEHHPRARCDAPTGSVAVPSPRLASTTAPVGLGSPPALQRSSLLAAGADSSRLLALRRALAPGTVPAAATAAAGVTGAAPRWALANEARAALMQTLRQFLAGYHDLDLRDVTGSGHGQIIVRHGVSAVAAEWASRLDAGELAGAAMTEVRGGSRLTPPHTRLTPDGPGRWRLNGHKRWTSRLDEASVFVVSASTEDERTVAVLVDADREGLHREHHQPAGLSGWSWGELTFDHVTVSERDLLVHDSPPSGIFADHFALYRQLVTATALGVACGVQDNVVGLLRARLDRGEIARPGDHALIALGDSDAAVRAALLSTLHTVRLAALSGPAAIARSAAAKAHGVETARHQVDQLAALAGAAGFARSHYIAKARNDLEALRFADGAHDSLRRHAGAQLLASASRRVT